MTCKQLGGACDEKFSANTFEEIAVLSKNHGMEMFKVSDKVHLAAMDEMSNLMKDTKAMQAWFTSKQIEFEELAED